MPFVISLPARVSLKSGQGFDFFWISAKIVGIMRTVIDLITIIVFVIVLLIIFFARLSSYGDLVNNLSASIYGQ